MRENNTEKKERFKCYESLLEKAKIHSEKRLGYPVSGMIGLYINNEDENSLEFSYKGTPDQKVIDNRPLGIIPNSMFEWQIFQVGDPWVDSLTYNNYNQQEREVIEIVGKYLGMNSGEIKGYVSSGGTEGNISAFWWSIRNFKQKNEINLNKLKESVYCEDSYNINFSKKFKLLNEMERPKVYFTQKETHYSIYKACDLLNLNYVEILAKQNGEMDTDDFSKKIKFHIENFPHINIIVNANIGTILKGAIDDIPEIYKILKEATEGTNTLYTIHADAALEGMLLPYVKPFGNVSNYFTDIGVNTMSICCTKFLGMEVSALALVRKEFLDVSFQQSKIVNYVGKISDTTVTGCRSVHTVLMIHNALHSLNLHKENSFIFKIIQNNFKNAQYFYDKLLSFLGEQNVFWNKYQLSILFKKPNIELIKKYVLMPVEENWVGVYVLQHVNKSKIDEFLDELEKTL
jgi:glutamate/tyrosine decarboxylase-like PLP-dependent enzyme